MCPLRGLARQVVLCLYLSALAVGIVRAQSAPQRQLAIPGVIAAEARLEIVRSGFKGSVEGPVATPDGGLYFTDEGASRIYRMNPNGDVTLWRENTDGTNGLYLLKDGRLLGAEGLGRRVVAMAPDGRVIPLATDFAGKGFRAPNDLISDKNGGVYFTDPLMRPPPNVKPMGNVYYISPSGRLLLIDAEIARPNGITLSLDEETLYVNDGLGMDVYAFDLQPDGSATNKRSFTKLREPITDEQGVRSRADGMAVDSMGRLYVATGSGIQVIDSRGEWLGMIRTPGIMRNIAFSGPERQTLYLTGADTLYRVRMIAKGPPARAK